MNPTKEYPPRKYRELKRVEPNMEDMYATRSPPKCDSVGQLSCESKTTIATKDPLETDCRNPSMSELAVHESGTLNTPVVSTEASD